MFFSVQGAGGAAVGIADLLVTAMLHSDPTLTSEEARKRIWLVDSQGLVTSCRTEDLKHKKAYAHEEDNCSVENSGTGLLDAINLVQPTALIGVSAQGQAFTKEVCEAMTGMSFY
jgi:malate dehydrogenase (oxaloacetate-decarboxylating)(NADP+)